MYLFFIIFLIFVYIFFPLGNDDLGNEHIPSRGSFEAMIFLSPFQVGYVLRMVPIQGMIMIQDASYHVLVCIQPSVRDGFPLL